MPRLTPPRSWVVGANKYRSGNGKISKDELSAVVVDDPNVQAVLGNKGLEVDEILAQVDSNQDGEIDFDEFVTMMRAGKKQ